jgi:hypothetical protein
LLLSLSFLDTKKDDHTTVTAPQTEKRTPHAMVIAAPSLLISPKDTRDPPKMQGEMSVFSLFPDAGTLGLTFFARHDKLVR